MRAQLTLIGLFFLGAVGCSQYENRRGAGSDDANLGLAGYGSMPAPSVSSYPNTSSYAGAYTTTVADNTSSSYSSPSVPMPPAHDAGVQTSSVAASPAAPAPSPAPAGKTAFGAAGAADKATGDICDPAVIANDRDAAEACFKQKAIDCAKGLYKGVPSSSGVVDQACVETIVKRCQACVTNPAADACMTCTNAALATCTTLPSIPVPVVDTYRACMTASVAGLGTFYLDVHNSIYDQHTQVNEEMAKVACNQTSDRGWHCSSACTLTNSCLNSNDPINHSQSERCDLCLMMCTQDPDYCKKLALE